MIELFDYQKRVVEFMENSELDHRAGGIICLEMGLGKTFTSLGLIFKHIDKLPKTLVVVPKTLLHNWENEYKKYQEGRAEIKFLKCYGSDMCKQLKHKDFDDKNLILTTYETIKRNQVFWNYDFSRIIIDESQIIRNAKNHITKHMRKLKSLKKWCLSGTPFFNNYSDLYSQCDFIGLPPYNEKRKWRNPDEQFLKDFRENFCFILKKEEAITLPKIHHHDINPILNKKEQDIYDKFKYFLNCGGNTLNYLIKIRQTCCNTKCLTKKENYCAMCTMFTPNEFACGHYICWKCDTAERRSRKRAIKTKCLACKVESTKFDKIVDIIQQFEDTDEKFVIFSQWKTMAHDLRKYLKKNGIKTHLIHGGVDIKKRNEYIEKFKTNSKKVLIATIQTCGTGVNITRANHVILLDSWWNSALEKQAINRLYRIGQEREVHVYHINIKSSIEQWINYKQRQKKIQAQILLNNNERENSYFRWLGKSYPNKLNKLRLNSYIDRDYLKISHDPELVAEWEKRQQAARTIQRFFINYIAAKPFVRNILDDKVGKDISGIIMDYTYVNKKQYILN